MELLRWPEHSTRDACLEFRDTSVALDFLRPWLDDPCSMLSLRALLAEDRGSIGVADLNDQEVLDQLAWCVVRGQVKIVPQIARLHAGTSIASGMAEQPIARAAEATQRTVTTSQTTLSWIKFRVVDDETGQPVQGVKLKVRLPAGTVKEYTTNADGMVQIDDLPSGTCDIEKMLDADALEVIGIV